MTVTPLNAHQGQSRATHPATVRGLNIAAALHRPLELFLLGEEAQVLHLHPQCGSEHATQPSGAPDVHAVEVLIVDMVLAQKSQPDTAPGLHSCVLDQFNDADWSTWDAVHDLVGLLVSAHAMLSGVDQKDEDEAPLTDAEASAAIRATLHLLSSGITEPFRFDVGRRNLTQAMRNPDIRSWVETEIAPHLRAVSEELLTRHARSRGRNWLVGVALQLLLRPTRSVSRGPNHHRPATWQHHDGPDLYPGRHTAGRRAMPFECSSTFEHELLTAVETMLASRRDITLTQAFELVQENLPDFIEAAQHAATEAGLALIAQMDGPTKWGQVPVDLTLAQLPGISSSSTVEEILHAAWRVAAEGEVRQLCEKLAQLATEEARSWTSQHQVEMWRIGTPNEVHHLLFDHLYATACDGTLLTVMPQWMSRALREAISATWVADFGPAAETDSAQLYSQLARLAEVHLVQADQGPAFAVATQAEALESGDLLNALRAAGT